MKFCVPLGETGLIKVAPPHGGRGLKSTSAITSGGIFSVAPRTGGVD